MNSVVPNVFIGYRGATSAGREKTGGCSIVFTMLMGGSSANGLDWMQTILMFEEPLDVCEGLAAKTLLCILGDVLKKSRVYSRGQFVR